MKSKGLIITARHAQIACWLGVGMRAHILWLDGFVVRNIT